MPFNKNFVEKLLFLFPSATAIPSREKKKKEMGVSEEGVCCKIVFLLKLRSEVQA